MSATWDTIIIGAGPAGMAAATTLAAAGVRTLLVDEQPAPGGQIYRAIERNEGNTALLAALGPSYGQGSQQVARMRDSGAELRLATSVWRVDPDGSVWTKSGGQVAQLQAKTLVIAAGAMERPVPVPGWTMPGVMTIGSLQIMLKSAGLRPSGRLVLAGSGPLFYLFATQCLDVGISDLVLLDTAARRNFLPALRYLPQALAGHGPAYLWKGLELVARLRRRGVEIYRQVSGLRIEGAERAKAVSFTADLRTHRLDLDLIALHEGVIPSQQIARSVGCTFEWNDLQQCFRPVLDAMGESSVPNVFITGDGGGIIGAEASSDSGTLCALAILRRMGKISETDFANRRREARRSRADHLTVRPFLDRLYRPREEILAPADDVIVCRCEVVHAAAIRAVTRQGCLGPNQAKAFLRCGMGPCQGNMCGHTVSSIMARETGQTPDQTGYYRIRAPLKPVTVGEMASQCEGG